jgi:hypothetical protein
VGVEGVDEAKVAEVKDAEEVEAESVDMVFLQIEGHRKIRNRKELEPETPSVSTNHCLCGSH